MGGAWLCALRKAQSGLRVPSAPLALEVLVRMQSLVLLTTGQFLGEP